ncbi:helix-turn-helix domain-containing protein [Marinitenerispora sediminis]|uniref:Transcriptional regulator n=1 Tax=Marinitenerispora sediminis TaxID=1931232 RepID=A0A368SXZ0_9ACTN|nr:helix-turn-helix transcriptional regulator [Marinitenerispora sediminis]RCV48003.1 transcriptional regulator [Marinitenerispora sediminis]RCV48568.1 transcriptional regulator [Marinitenerispora sediminis]RCV57486.1 transcriptional regulator [Marinitenerispora sediminis]
MTSLRSPSVRRRRLAAELRRLREQAGYTAEQASLKLGWSKGRLNRWEANQWTRPDISALRDLLNLYKVSGQHQEALLDLARSSRQKGWWTEYRDVFGEGAFVGLEAEASTIRSYQPVVIPGLLQTAAYAQALMVGARMYDATEVERRVQARLARQAVLRQREDAPQFWAIIEEAVLYRMIGDSGVMAEQLKALVDANEQPNVNIQIILNSFGAHAGLGGQFVILDFPNEQDSSVVYLDTPTERLLLEKREQIARYNLLFQHVSGAAISPSESTLFMRDRIEQLR